MHWPQSWPGVFDGLGFAGEASGDGPEGTVIVAVIGGIPDEAGAGLLRVGMARRIRARRRVWKMWMCISWVVGSMELE